MSRQQVQNKHKQQSNIKEENQQQKVLDDILLHIERVPSQIEQAVLLVCYEENSKKLFEKLANIQERKDQNSKLPCIAELRPGLILIDGSQRLLKPEIDRNFISLYYIIRSLRKCKFIFVFTDFHSFDKGIKTVKATFMQFISIFKKNLDQSFWNSVAILITDRNEDKNLQAYRSAILSEKKGIRQKNQSTNGKQFLEGQRAQDVKTLAKKIEEKNRLLLFKSGNSDQIREREEFIKFVDGLQFFTVNQKGKSDATIGLVTKQKQYIERNHEGNGLQSKWKTMLASILDKSIDLFKEINIGQTQKTILSDLQKLGIRQKFKIHSLNLFSLFPELKEQQKLQKNCSKLRQGTLFAYRFLLICQTILNHPNENTSIKINRKIVMDFFRALYDCRLILSPVIINFFASYFIIYDKFQNKNGKPQNSLLEKADFFQLFHKQVNHILRQLISIILQKIEEVLASQSNEHQNCKSILLDLQQFILLSKKDKIIENIKCFTERIKKKLQKGYLHLILYQAKNQRVFKDKMDGFKKFFQTVDSCDLISSSVKSDAYILVGNQLLKPEINLQALALKCYLESSQIKVLQRILKIYECKYKIHEDNLKYLRNDEWDKAMTLFAEFTNYLVRLGFFQKVRTLCYLGLQRAIKPEQISILKLQLIKARRQQGIKSHNEFLQTCIIDQKQIKTNTKLLDEIWRSISTIVLGFK